MEACLLSPLRHYNELMVEVSMVDLVGVGLNATDTLIPLPPIRIAAQRRNTVQFR